MIFSLIAEAQFDAEFISRRIKDRITPLPYFVLTPHSENGKTFLELEIKAGLIKRKGAKKNGRWSVIQENTD